jgi:hypothetical protein
MACVIALSLATTHNGITKMSKMEITCTNMKIKCTRNSDFAYPMGFAGIAALAMSPAPVLWVSRPVFFPMIRDAARF